MDFPDSFPLFKEKIKTGGDESEETFSFPDFDHVKEQLKHLILSVKK